ncbi:hypothetical protein [Stenotrophomonas sp.]|uniref:hypothetical protein n=1 Tax=Stenotrophomonas sp. TaxID=69392 RepID=UPI0029AAD085|nr:hypothetical protein [Stenotrophomonas sp.]MDX3934003.1 hypothetical protein [Stenotrophomonas sp.]
MDNVISSTWLRGPQSVALRDECAYRCAWALTLRAQSTIAPAGCTDAPAEGRSGVSHISD